jgi:class 3 adenylate cyclase
MAEPGYSLADLDIRSIEDLIPATYLQKIRDTFARSTGIQIVIGRTTPGQELTRPEPYAFCARLRENPDFLGRCLADYLGSVDEMLVTEGIRVAECHLGFWMFGAPIEVDGTPLGLFGGCMVRPRDGHIDALRCREICARYRYPGDADQLFASLAEIPTYGRDQLERTLAIFKEMANALSEVARRQFQLKVEEAKRSRLERYFSPRIYQLIEARGADLGYSGEASILFSDIRDFTGKSERMTPAAVVSMLNQYFEEMVEAVFHHDGTLDKFIGDAVLAVFGAPIPSAENAIHAARAAQERLDRVAALNRRRSADGHEPIEIGIGIHTGPVVGGNIGSPKRMEYTVVGDTVNVASRLEGLTRRYPEAIVVSERTYAMIADQVDVAGVDEIQLKGRSEPTRIYRVARVR